MRRKDKLLFGIGRNDFNGPIFVDGKLINSYKTWTNMLERCYYCKYQEKHPSYKGCSVCNQWLSFSKFKSWFDENYREGMSLEKDILSKGNRIYCPEYCKFVPQALNNLLIKNDACRGDFPIGVSFNKKTNKYFAQCRNNYGKNCYLGQFNTSEEAFQAYKEFKKQIITNAALIYFGRGEIDKQTFRALCRYEVEEND